MSDPYNMQRTGEFSPLVYRECTNSLIPLMSNTLVLVLKPLCPVCLHVVCVCTGVGGGGGGRPN